MYTDKIKYWVIDIDGTMTDGGLYYDEHGNEIKKFSTKDAAGFLAAHQLKMKTIVLTGRECFATLQRMKELKVDFIFQNIINKKQFLEQFFIENSIGRDEVAYIGDDLNDLAAMQLAGFVGCPKDSCVEVLEKADYVSNICGGYGAVRDIMEYVMRKNSQWEWAIQQIYGAGI